MWYNLVLIALSSLHTPAEAGVWVGTPVGGVVAPTPGYFLTRADLHILPPVFKACSGPDAVLTGFTLIDALDPEPDFAIPDGCWTELQLSVTSAEIDGEAAAGAFAAELDGWTAVVSLETPEPGPLLLALGQGAWLDPVAPYLGEDTLVVAPGSELGEALRQGLAAKARLW